MQKSFFKKTLVFVFVASALLFSQGAVETARAFDPLVTCGKAGQPMCNLCNLIEGIHNVADYLMKISIGIALAVLTAAGIMYIISAGDSKMTEMAKSAMKSAAVGFIVVFSAYLIIDGIVLRALGAKTDLGMQVTGWGKFECTANKGIK